MGELEEFRQAGRTLFSLGLVRGAEGNLSTFDGSTLRITRTGCSLSAIEEDDVATGSLEDDLPGASTDLQVHRRMYRERGHGAIAHAHPAGTVSEASGGPGRHGVYEFAPTLDEAVVAVVAAARELAGQSEGSAT